MKEITREWLKAADDDLLAIQNLLSNSDITNIIAFHAQQAIEKILKAFIEEFDISFVKTHNLQTLFYKIESIFPYTINESLLAELDRLYIDSRYPGNMGLMPSLTYVKISLDAIQGDSQPNNIETD